MYNQARGFVRSKFKVGVNRFTCGNQLSSEVLSVAVFIGASTCREFTTIARAHTSIDATDQSCEVPLLDSNETVPRNKSSLKS